MARFTDEQLMDLGRITASLFDMRDAGRKMLEEVAADMGSTLEECGLAVGEVAQAFTLKDDQTRYRLTLDVDKTEEEALEGMPTGTEYLGGGLYAVPDEFDDEEG